MANGWSSFFKEIAKKDYCKSLNAFLDKEYSSYTVYPPREKMFNAFLNTDPRSIKVIIIGQDPYHEPDQAMGMCFSVPEGIKIPPSLVNIYKEIEREYNHPMNNSGDLTYLSKQGVLLLNTILSVRAHQPLSHNIPEYKAFIIDVLNYIDLLDQPIVFMLWGGPAKSYSKYINNKNRLILTSVHPSPLSANRGGWFGNNHFKTANEYLIAHNLKPIVWFNN